MAEKKQLESFKAGASQRPTITGSKRDEAAARQAQSEAMSVGFRRIETMLEEETLEGINERLGSIRHQLGQLDSQSTTNRDKAAAKKAIVAVDRTQDLVEYLYQIKESMTATT